jgi:serine/threonine protein kinase
VKPENILLVDDPERAAGFTVKLVDFGLAKPDWTHETKALSAGTPCYMSPEHLLGHAPANPALDSWGLAATAFVAVTAVLPFDGDELAEVVDRVCKRPAPVPSRVLNRVPAGFDGWFARACARDPKDRFASPLDLASALAGLCPTEGESGTSVVAPVALRRTS